MSVLLQHRNQHCPLTIRRTVGALSAAACFLLAPLAARAADPSQAFQIVFAPATQTVSPSTVAFFFGSITNTTDSDLYITGDVFDALAPGLTPDDSPFFDTFLAGAPVKLGASQTYSLTSLFSVKDADALNGFYQGRFTVLGGTTLDSQDLSGSEAFSVHVVPDAVQAVPEASTSASLAVLLLGGMAVIAVRRKRTARA